MVEQHYDVIVIGSGIGGLTAAGLLAKRDHKRVLVLEQHVVAGGLTHTFRRGNHGKLYQWDVGLHYIGEMATGNLPRQVLDYVSNNDIHWHKMPDEFETFLYPGFRFVQVSDEKRFCQHLCVHFPDETNAIQRYFQDMKLLRDWFIADFLQPVLPRWIGWGMQWWYQRVNKLAQMTTQAYLDLRFNNPQLKALLVSQWGDYGVPPQHSALAIHALIVTHYLNGAWYPQDGARSIAKAIIPTLQAHGGDCLIRQEVTELLVEQGAVCGVKTLKRGQVSTFHAPVVISNVGAYETYNRLLAGHVADDYATQLQSLTEQGISAVTLYLGLHTSPETLGFLGENVWIHSGYDHNNLAHAMQSLLDGKPTHCYVSFPSLKDPAATYHTAEIITFIDYQFFAQWQAQQWLKRDAEYTALKAKMTAGLLNLVEQHYHGFKALVDYQELSTPLTIEHFTHRHHGHMYGIPATLARQQLDWLQPRTPLSGFYLTGSDVCSVGVVGAVMGGLATAADIKGQWGLMDLMWGIKGG